MDVSLWRSLAVTSSLDPELIDVSELHTALDDLPWWNPLGWFSDSPTTDEQLKQFAGWQPAYEKA